MATQAIKHIRVVTGSYTTGNGQKRNRYRVIGSIMQKDDGGKFMLLDATVVSSQLFALCCRDGSDQIMCNVVDAPGAEPQPQPQGTGRPAPTRIPPGGAHAGNQGGYSQGTPQHEPGADLDEPPYDAPSR